MEATPKLAPPEALVRYLAPFRRAFAAVATYARRRDRGGLLLGGYVADALHNVPAVLWRYDESAWHAPAAMRDWLVFAFARVRP